MMRDYYLKQIRRTRETEDALDEATRLLSKIAADVHWCRRSDIAREITTWLRKQKQNNE